MPVANHVWGFFRHGVHLFVWIGPFLLFSCCEVCVCVCVFLLGLSLGTFDTYFLRMLPLGSMNLSQHPLPDPQMQVPKWDMTTELSEFITAGD